MAKNFTVEELLGKMDEGLAEDTESVKIVAIAAIAVAISDLARAITRLTEVVESLVAIHLGLHKE